MRKFGKKNVIKIDPLAYNTGLLGESGIGKTTLAKEVCEKLVGEDGYIIANVGREDGIDAIAGAIYEDIPDWDTFDEFTEDIIENKLTDYKDLKVIIWDTIDELIRISEPEAIRLYNKEVRENPSKKEKREAKTIKQAWGGYGEGEKYTIDLIMERMWELKKVGIAMFLVGHTKKRTMNDPVSGMDYDILTTNMQYNYFNALKTKLHILGVASIDREIIQEKTGKKDFNGKDKIQGKVSNEIRKITFRDDNFNIDSKSRFSGIIDSIVFDSDEFIKAIEDAIKIEHEKQPDKKSIEETKQEQDIKKNKVVEEIATKKKEEIQRKNEVELRENLISEFKELMAVIVSEKDKEKVSKITKKMKELELSAKELDSADINKLQEFVEFVKTV
ncbi:MAG: AAA family ATPase [Candidatus Pacebacteria bacterium]|nr:AAA family ATPase [Candidatus Paceibacterota bacterium]